MSSEVASFGMTLQSSDMDPSDLPRLTQQLRDELLDAIDIQRADFAAGKQLNGTKSGIVVDWNTLVITLITAGGVVTTSITAIVTLTQAWLNRNKDRNLSIKFSNGATLTAENLSLDEQKRLVNMLLDELRGFTPRSS